VKSNCPEIRRLRLGIRYRYGAIRSEKGRFLKTDSPQQL